MAKIWTISNEKGGVGKTTAAANIGAGLINKGFKVLFVDLDKQGNLSFTLRADKRKTNIFDCLLDPRKAKEAIQTTAEGDIIPNSIRLAEANNVITETGKEYKLREVLEQVQENYDYIIIDTPPTLGILTVNALTAADSCIIPVHASIYSFLGFSQLYENLRSVRKYCNPKIKILGILINIYNGRAILSRDIKAAFDEAAAACDTVVLNSKIRSCKAIEEAQTKRINIFKYAPKSNGSLDFKAVVEELLERERILDNGNQ